MKKFGRLLCVVALAALILGSAVVPAEAADLEYSFRGTVGELAYFIITSDAYDEITEARIYNGVIPGMELDVAGGVTLGLVGTPTSEGEFTVFITLVTRKEGTLDLKVTVTVAAAPAAGGESDFGTPRITKHPTGETVVEGESAVFIARAEHVRQYNWVIAIADAEIDCADLKDYIGGDIKVSGYDTEKLEISNIPAGLDGAYVWCRFVGAEGSVTSSAAKITVIAQKDAIPVVTKDPTDETVEEGGEAVFVAKAKYAQEYLWQLVSPDGITYDCADAGKTFQGLKVSGADTERLVLSNIPLELDGFRVYCKFTAGDVIAGNMAKLSVTAKNAETEPPVSESAEVTEAVSTEAPADVPADAPAETEAAVSTEAAKQPPEESGKNGNDRTTLLIVAIIAATVVAVSGIAGFVILKLKTSK